MTNARTIAQLQAITLAVQMFGLDRIRDGSVTINPDPYTPESPDQIKARDLKARALWELQT